MSKLFETLEQIRRNEAAAKKPAASAPVAPSAKEPSRQPKKPLRRLAPLLLIAALAAGLALWQRPALIALFHRGPGLTAKGPGQQVTLPAQERTVPPPALPADTVKTAAPAAEVPAQPAGSPEFVRLNNQAADLASRGQYWPAIGLLNQAIKLEPKRPEPLINMGVALAELGLYGPAVRYLRQAQAIAPDNVKLQENLELLARAGFLEAAK